MSWYLDASCCVPLFAAERTSSSIADFIETSGEVFISDFGVGETCSALSRKVREGVLSATQAKAAFQELDLWTVGAATLVETSSTDLRRAMALVRQLELKLRFPDALQLAIAIGLDAALLTRDKTLAAAAERVAARTRLLP